MSEIPPGEYFVQAMVNVYSEFKRADGHVVWMHDDQWEGPALEPLAGKSLQRRRRRSSVDPKRGRHDRAERDAT